MTIERGVSEVTLDVPIDLALGYSPLVLGETPFRVRPVARATESVIPLKGQVELLDDVLPWTREMRVRNAFVRPLVQIIPHDNLSKIERQMAQKQIS